MGENTNQQKKGTCERMISNKTSFSMKSTQSSIITHFTSPFFPNFRSNEINDKGATVTMETFSAFWCHCRVFPSNSASSCDGVLTSTVKCSAVSQFRAGPPEVTFQTVNNKWYHIWHSSDLVQISRDAQNVWIMGTEYYYAANKKKSEQKKINKYMNCYSLVRACSCCLTWCGQKYEIIHVYRQHLMLGIYKTNYIINNINFLNPKKWK